MDGDIGNGDTHETQGELEGEKSFTTLLTLSSRPKFPKQDYYSLAPEKAAQSRYLYKSAIVAHLTCS